MFKSFAPLKVLVASSVGGGLEIYDFVIYIFFAPIIASQFFPKEDRFAAFLATFGIFAIGYFMRPVGGIIFGYLGDRSGRKKWLLVSILLMGIATIAIGCLPTYRQAGVLAPILLTILRLLQGVAVGGDLPGGITFVAEHAQTRARGLNCATVYLGVNFGLLSASAVAAIIVGVVSKSELYSWGWRIGFWLSAFLVLLGVYLRSGLDESLIFKQVREQLVKNPLIELFHGNGALKLLMAVGLMWLFAVIIVQIFMYMPVFLSEHVNNLSHQRALLINTVSTAIFSLLIPIMGYVSDRIGRRRMLIIASAAWIVLSYPIFSLLMMSKFTDVMFGLLILDVLSAMVVGTMPAVLAELFDTKKRYTGVALTYNIGFALFGGLTPIILNPPF